MVHARFEALQIPKMLFADLAIHPDDAGVGLAGSGLMIVNPPYGADDYLKRCLCRDSQGDRCARRRLRGSSPADARANGTIGLQLSGLIHGQRFLTRSRRQAACGNDRRASGGPEVRESLSEMMQDINRLIDKPAARRPRRTGRCRTAWRGSRCNSRPITRHWRRARGGWSICWARSVSDSRGPDDRIQHLGGDAFDRLDIRGRDRA